MDNMMKYLQIILLGMVMLVNPIVASIGFLGLSIFCFQKHDWQNGFFKDRWGLLGFTSFILGLVVYATCMHAVPGLMRALPRWAERKRKRLC